MLARLRGEVQVWRQGVSAPLSAEGTSAAALVLLEFGQQCLVVDLQRLGGFRFVSATGSEDAFDVKAFDLVEGQVGLVVR